MLLCADGCAQSVELMDLTDPAACIRSLNTVRGALVIYDDGSIPDLSALARLRTVQVRRNKRVSLITALSTSGAFFPFV